MRISSLTSVATFVLFFGMLCGSLVQAPLAIAAQAQTSNVYAPFGCTPGVDCDVVGTSRLVRTPNGISMTLQTTDLDPGAVYTVWWVIFNNPSACMDGCDGSDLADEDVLGTVLHATGHVIGANETGNFAAYLAEGDTSGDSFPIVFPGDAVGLMDSTQAEVHLVVRTHGPPIPGQVDDQRGTFNGGCDVNSCEDQQFAVHLP